jgi:uncharacterized membrane protein YdjX (TVP38/TMEM64 family)
MTKQMLKKYLPMGVIIILMIAAWQLGVQERVSLANFQAHKLELTDFVTAHAFGAAVIFMAVYVVAVALSLPIATLLTLMGGFLFGVGQGTIYVVSAATLGATIIFLVAKSALGASLRAKAGGLYQKIEKNMQENAVSYLLFLRLVPLFPFFLVNIVPALFKVPVRIFVLTTFFGIIPGSFVFVNLGQSLGELETLNDLVSWKILFSFALLGVFALVPTLYKYIKGGVKK